MRGKWHGCPGLVWNVCCLLKYQFFFPRMKKELPSGIGTIFSLGPENSGFNGATPTHTRHTRWTSSGLSQYGWSFSWQSHSPSSPSMALSSSFSCQSSSSFYGQKCKKSPDLSILSLPNINTKCAEVTSGHVVPLHLHFLSLHLHPTPLLPPFSPWRSITLY